MKTLDGKTALVTGAGSGIGRATAYKFSQSGAAVVVSDVDVKNGKETADEIERGGGRAIFVKCDISKVQEVKALIDTAVETYGQLDIAFNNAGVHELPRMSEIADADIEGWSRVIDINLKGVFHCMKYELMHMKERGKGVIVNTSSRVGSIGDPGSSAYVASKHGVLGLTKTGAIEAGPFGIRVNAVCPGAIKTNMMKTLLGDIDPDKIAGKTTPAGRAGTPEEIANAVLWLCSDEASFVSGHALSVDGGWCAK